MAKKKNSSKCTVKIGDFIQDGAPELSELVRQGAELYEELRALREELNTVNSQILGRIESELKSAPVSTAHVLAEDVDCVIALKSDTFIADEDALEAYLGSRFSDLVNVRRVCSVTEKLLMLAYDDPKVAASLVTKERKPSVTYRKQ